MNKPWEVKIATAMKKKFSPKEIKELDKGFKSLTMFFFLAPFVPLVFLGIILLLMSGVR